MSTDHRDRLAKIKRFDQLIAYLRDEMGWPIDRIEIDDLMFDYAPEELGIDPKNAAKIEEIKRLRPLSARQPWGIFFLKFAPNKLPVVALRRILSQVVLRKRATAKAAERAAWAADDLLFISNYGGEGEARRISFAHFSQAEGKQDLPTLRVLGWDDLDTALHLDAVAHGLTTHLTWPTDEANAEAWRKSWRGAFTLRHREVITTSKDLSIHLAKLARAIHDRIKAALAIETDRGPLTKLMNAFREALVHDLDADGFADMYAQTIAYGLLSARIADPHKKTADDFTAHMRTNPFLRELMETFLHVGGRRGRAGGTGIDFDELGVSEVVDLLDDANMEAVVGDFGDKNPQEDPVIHFYELFLKEYDAKKRMQRGVFYTPRPVVSYIVRSVDELLRTEFGLEDGLADTTTWGEMAKRFSSPSPRSRGEEGRGEGEFRIPEGTSPGQAFVQILDPACGTGTFLVEVIDIIHKTLTGKWKAQGHGDEKIEALWNDYVPEHLLPRLYGYELLMAPYAIAHLKIGLKLYETGYRFDCDERARVFLTNALEPASDTQPRITTLTALAHEAQAVNEIKRNQRFTVVIGNPPYSGHSRNAGEWAQTLVREYFLVDGVPIDERNPKWLQDDYVKFIRLAQFAVDLSSVGVAGLITNHGYLENPTFRGLRRALMLAFQSARFLDLHGDSKTGEENPTGRVDENVFEIQKGVAIALLAKAPPAKRGSSVLYTELWGARAEKYLALARGAAKDLSFAALSPVAPFFVFRPQDAAVRDEYQAYPSLTEVMPISSVGFVTSRDEFVLGYSRAELLQRFGEFRDRRVSDAVIGEKYAVGDLDVPAARRHFRERVAWEESIVPCLYRPFDIRWICYAEELLERPRRSVMQHLLGAVRNLALISARSNKSAQMNHFYCARAIAETKCAEASTQSCVFPLYLQGEVRLGDQARANLSSVFTSRLPQAPGAEKGRLTPEGIVSFAYAAFHSPAYRVRYREFLRLDFPRVPVPGSAALFHDLARLGGELIALHLLESPKLNHSITTYLGPKDPEVERVGWSDGTVWLDAAATKKGQPAAPGTIGFHGVPEAVWNFHIGGYQVCEKWLKDRKGRTLSKDDIAHYQKIVVALNETIRLMREIDEVIEEHGGWPGAFQTDAPVASAAPAAVASAARAAGVVPFRPRGTKPKPDEHYVTCVPLVPLKAAAGAFGDPQRIDDREFEWVEVKSSHRLRRGMFVAQVIGKSMEPAIPDGSYCLFAAPVDGTRQGKTVLVQLRDATDPETGERYTVKRYESDKTEQGDLWRHTTITLKPMSPDFEPIVLTDADEGQLQVIAELIEVLKAES